MERDEWNEKCQRFYADNFYPHPLLSDALKGKGGEVERQRIEIILGFIRDNAVRGQRVADVGCQEGYVSDKLSKLGLNVTGIDTVPYFIDWGNLRYPHLELVNGFFEDLGYNNEFDFVVCTETFEHVSNAHQLLKAIHDSMKQGGYLIASVPVPKHGEYPTHYKLWGKRMFEDFIKTYFSIHSTTVFSKWNIVVATKGEVVICE